MGLTMNEQKGVAREMARQLIEEYMELTGCTRHHAAWLLRCKIVVGQRRAQRRTPQVYDQEVIAALIKLWHHFGYLCGKRLAATLRLWLPNYERWDARSKRKIALTPELRQAGAHQPGNHRSAAAHRETQADAARAQSHQAAHRQPDAAVPPWLFFKTPATMCARPTSSASGPPCSTPAMAARTPRTPSAFWS